MSAYRTSVERRLTVSPATFSTLRATHPASYRSQSIRHLITRAITVSRLTDTLPRLVWLSHLIIDHHSSLIILVHSPTFAAVHHINHRQSLFSYNFTIVNLNQPSPSLIQHLNHHTTTSHTLVIHHLLSVGSLLRLVHHRHHSQRCASHQQFSSTYSTCEHRSTQLLTSLRPSLQPNLQHASIHAPSCIVVRESPCSR